MVNLCERRIFEEIYRDGMEKTTFDVIDLLQTCQLCNANSLAQWLLHFISLNYDAFSAEHDLSRLKDDDLAKVKIQRHPPEAYVCMMQEYRAGVQQRKKRDRCSVM